MSEFKEGDEACMLEVTITMGKVITDPCTNTSDFAPDYPTEPKQYVVLGATKQACLDWLKKRLDEL